MDTNNNEYREKCYSWHNQCKQFAKGFLGRIIPPLAKLVLALFVSTFPGRNPDHNQSRPCFTILSSSIQNYAHNFSRVSVHEGFIQHNLWIRLRVSLAHLTASCVCHHRSISNSVTIRANTRDFNSVVPLLNRHNVVRGYSDFDQVRFIGSTQHTRVTRRRSLDEHALLPCERTARALLILPSISRLEMKWYLEMKLQFSPILPVKLVYQGMWRISVCDIFQAYSNTVRHSHEALDMGLHFRTTGS